MNNSPAKPFPGQTQQQLANGQANNQNATNPNNQQPLANMAQYTNSTSVLLNQQQQQQSLNHHSQSPSPLHFNLANNTSTNNSTNTNTVYVQQQQAQQQAYVASSPKHNHHPNLASPVNYMTPVNYVSMPGQTGTMSMNPVQVGQNIVSGGCGGSGLGSDSGSNSNMSYPPNFVNYITTNNVTTATCSNPVANQVNANSLNALTIKLHKFAQTEITTNQMIDSASAIETKNTRIDELIRVSYKF